MKYSSPELVLVSSARAVVLGSPGEPQEGLDTIVAAIVTNMDV